MLSPCYCPCLALVPLGILPSTPPPVVVPLSPLLVSSCHCFPTHLSSGHHCPCPHLLTVLIATTASPSPLPPPGLPFPPSPLPPLGLPFPPSPSWSPLSFSPSPPPHHHCHLSTLPPSLSLSSFGLPSSLSSPPAPLIVVVVVSSCLPYHCHLLLPPSSLSSPLPHSS